MNCGVLLLNSCIRETQVHLVIFFVPLSIVPVSFRSMYHVCQYEAEIQLKSWSGVGSSEADHLQGHWAARIKHLAFAYPLLENDIAFQDFFIDACRCTKQSKNIHSRVCDLGKKWKQWEHLEKGTVKVYLWQSFPHHLKTMPMLRTVHSENKICQKQEVARWKPWINGLSPAHSRDSKCRFQEQAASSLPQPRSSSKAVTGANLASSGKCTIMYSYFSKYIVWSWTKIGLLWKKHTHRDTSGVSPNNKLSSQQASTQGLLRSKVVQFQVCSWWDLGNRAERYYSWAHQMSSRAWSYKQIPKSFCVAL